MTLLAGNSFSRADRQPIAEESKKDRRTVMCGRLKSFHQKTFEKTKNHWKLVGALTSSQFENFVQRH